MKTWVWGLALLLLAGCGSSASVSPPAPVEEGGYINGKKVADFYRQFQYRKIEGEDLPYRYLSNGYTKLKTIGPNKNLYFTANIFLLENGEYVLDYNEVTGEKSEDGFMTLTTVFTQRYKGRWKVDYIAIQLDSRIRGAGATVNEKDVLSLTFQEPFNAPELKDKADIFYYTSSTQGLD